MKVKLLFFVSVLFSWLFFSCHTDVNCVDCAPGNELRKYPNGVFVVNEGPFGGTGTISWYNPATGEVQDSIYEKANNGASLGQFVQSLTFHNGKAYIVVNGANRVVVADAETFEYIDTIGGLALPRYFLPISDEVAFVSQWGADGISGSLAKVNLKTNKITVTFPTGSGSEKMVYCSDFRRLYVANSGGYGVDSTVAIISTDIDNQIAHRTVIPGQKNPCCFGSGCIGGFLPGRLLCRGDWADPNSLGWIGDPFNTASNGLPAPRGADDLATSPNGSTYFIAGNAIYKYNPGVTKLFDQAAYGFNIHPVSGDFYCADAKDFNSAGEVVVRKEDGTVVQRFRAGISPGEVVFVE
jgi:DNA-binding beta-propeller fold protein YncE